MSIKYINMSKKDQLVDKMMNLWSNRKSYNGVQYWSTSTFKIEDDDCWLGISIDQKKYIPVGNWNGGAIGHWLHLVRIHDRKLMYQDGLLYCKNLSMDEQKVLIKLLVYDKLKDEDINQCSLLRF